MSATDIQTSLTLKGSARIITKYLKYAFHAILYQRGIEPSDQFRSVREYGLSLWMSKNEATVTFLTDVLNQVCEWISRKEMDRISLVFRDRSADEVEEFWQFTVEREPKIDPYCSDTYTSLRQIQRDITSVMRQITGTISFLPRIENVAMEVSVHFVKPMSADEMPPNWRPAQAPFIRNAETVPLRSFSTGLHFMQTSVNFKGKNDGYWPSICSDASGF